MAQLVVSAAGAAIGFMIGGPVGAQIGWAAGSLLASSMGPGIQGPRLSDATVQVSSYGAALGTTYGGVRKAGNVIWSTDLVEAASEEGGKGGPSVTNFTYSVSCAVAIGEGVIPGIRRIWADAKLVYDAREDADAAAQAASAAFAEFFTFYTGSETQLPDPTIEAVEGVGIVEAYRGTSYVVFTGLPLADYGNRIPNFQFETTTAAAEGAVVSEAAALEIRPWDENGDEPIHSQGGITRYWAQTEPDAGFDGDYGWQACDSLAEAIAVMQAAWPLHTTQLGYFPQMGDQWWSIFGEDTGLNDGLGTRYLYLCFNVETPAVIVNGGIGAGTACAELQAAGLDPVSNPVAGAFSITDYTAGGFGGASPHAGLIRIVPYGEDPPIASYETVNNCTTFPPVEGHFPQAYLSRNKHIRVERAPSPPESTCAPGNPAVLGIAQVPGNPAFCISSDGEISPNFSYSIQAGTYRQLAVATIIASEYTRLPVGPVLPLGHPDYSSEAFWEAAAAAAGIPGSYPGDFPIEVDEAAYGSFDSTRYEAGSVLLSTIVTDVCTAAGLAPAQIDVSALTDSVLGFSIGRQMPARQALEPLRQAFWFDAVESGRQIRFVKRGGASVATLELEDLGASESGDAEPVESQRGQEAELPTSVTVAYSARSADYQTGTQTQRRETTLSRQEQTVETPVVLTDLKAAQAADVLLYDAWIGRNERRITTTRKHARLEPTDPITVTDAEFTYRARITEKAEDGGVIRFVTRDEDAAAYSPNSMAIATPGGGGAVRFNGPTRLVLLDLPILRDVDDAAGYYVAACGYGPAWRGARLFRSVDGGATYDPVRDLNRTAVLGIADTGLGNYAGGNTVDELNAVDVRLPSGTLSSITRAQLLDNGNVAALGDEIIQFQRAELVSDRTYRLTGLLRGRCGTERHMASHAAEERFVLLDEARIYRESDTLSLIGVETAFKAVTNGQALDAALEIAFTDTGESLLPLSVVHLRAWPIGNGRFEAAWIRRTRYTGDWLPAVDVALGEAAEAYDVEVLDGDTVVLSQQVSEPGVVLGQTEPSFDLVSAATHIQEIGGILYGTGPSTAPLRRYNADGTSAGGGAYLGEKSFSSATNATDYYVSVGNAPAVSKVRRVSSAAPGTVAASLDGSSSNDQRGLCFDGTDLWVANVYSGTIQRLHPTTLAVVNTYPVTGGPCAIDSEGGSLWVCACDSDELVEIDPTDGSEIQRFAVVNFPTDVAVVGSIAVVGGASQAASYDVTTGSQVAAVDATGVPGSRTVLRWAPFIAASHANGAVVTLFDETTGLVDDTLAVEALQFLGGATATSLFVLIGTSTPPTVTRAYGGGTAIDLSGMTLRIWQRSAAIGRGHVAETILE